ncbi:hypothetical protein MMC22_003212 [Lobaria immixta]|nr:hypothetical protein [Lobaria immixta]
MRRYERAGRMGRGTRGRARDARGRRSTTESEQHQQPTHLDDDDEPNEGVSILDQEGESGNESDDFQETLDEQLAFHHSPPRMPQLGEPSQTTVGIDTTTSATFSPPDSRISSSPIIVSYQLADDLEEENEARDSDSSDTMSGSSSTLTEAAHIKPLNGRDDWTEWDEKLQGQLGMIDLYVILTNASHEPNATTSPKEYNKWAEYQRRLKGLLLCITGLHPKSILMNNASLTAVAQYTLLKEEYNTQTITTFSQLFRRIHKCSLADHKSLKEYGDKFIQTRNKLQQLNQPLSPLQLVCAFLDGLDESYQSWKDQLFSQYISKPTRQIVNKDQTVSIMNIPDIEEIIKQLRDREDGLSKFKQSGATWAFRAKGSQSSQSKKSKEGSTKSEAKCHVCGSPHLKPACFFSNVEKAPDTWKAKFNTPKKRKAQLELTRKRFKREAPASDQQQAYIVCNVTATGHSKDLNWYADCAASSHITHAISAFLSTDLDNNTEEILATDRVILRTRGSSTIALATSVNGNDSFIHLHNVHYCPEIDTNLLSLGALEAKKLWFLAENSMLEV